jgi:acetolactate synthase-1/2/3 large subunit
MKAAQYRNSGKLGVCCTTSGPGATNAITGAAVANENNTPLLIITAQTAMANFGKRAFQDSADTGIDTTALFKLCTRYSSMVSHREQFESKLVRAIMTAYCDNKGPVHLSIPPDILRNQAPVATPTYHLPSLIKQPSTIDIDSIQRLEREIRNSQQTVFILGNRCAEAMPCLLQIFEILNSPVLTTPDGKGLIDPKHPLYQGVFGFAGHQSANDTLTNPNVDMIIAVGTSLSEWTSNGWDKQALLCQRLIHIDDNEYHLPQSPMARLHVRGRLLTVFNALKNQLITQPRKTDKKLFHQPPPLAANPFKENLKKQHAHGAQVSERPVKPQWLMTQLTDIFPSDTRYVIDTGNCFCWAVHYLHPFSPSTNQHPAFNNSSTFQTAIEFSSMGWAIGSAIGAAMAAPGPATVAITGDGSWLMSGQEITTALQENVPVIFIILNDSSLGMVKHGQRLAGAEAIGYKMPAVDFKTMAESMGADGYLIESNQDLLQLDIETLLASKRPCVIDVRIDAEQVPPMGVRMKVLQQKSSSSKISQTKDADATTPLKEPEALL